MRRRLERGSRVSPLELADKDIPVDDLVAAGTLRAAVQTERLLFYTHFSLGQLAGAARYTDVLVSDTDLALQTEESYAAYTVHPHWSIAIGRPEPAGTPPGAGLVVRRSHRLHHAAGDAPQPLRQHHRGQQQRHAADRRASGPASDRP